MDRVMANDTARAAARQAEGLERERLAAVLRKADAQQDELCAWLPTAGVLLPIQQAEQGKRSALQARVAQDAAGRARQADSGSGITANTAADIGQGPAPGKGGHALSGADAIESRRAAEAPHARSGNSGSEGSETTDTRGARVSGTRLEWLSDAARQKQAGLSFAVSAVDTPGNGGAGIGAGNGNGAAGGDAADVGDVGDGVMAEMAASAEAVLTTSSDQAGHGADDKGNERAGASMPATFIPGMTSWSSGTAAAGSPLAHSHNPAQPHSQAPTTPQPQAHAGSGNEEWTYQFRAWKGQHAVTIAANTGAERTGFLLRPASDLAEQRLRQHGAGTDGGYRIQAHDAHRDGRGAIGDANDPQGDPAWA